MAEEQEEIIIIEESDAAGVEKTSETTETPSDEKPSLLKNKKLIIIVAGALVLLLSIGGGLVFVFSGHAEDANATLEQPIAAHAPEEEPLIEPSELENMIEQANYLYANGNQNEALKLYEKIALYSEAISQYNLGVVQLKEGEFEAALENFKHSIDNRFSLLSMECLKFSNAASNSPSLS